MRHSLLDDRIYVETAEGVVLSAVLADPLSRAYALIIDVLLILGLLFVCLFIAAFLPDIYVAQGFFLLMYFLLMWGYFFFCEWRFSGRTLGKKMMNLQVVGADLLPVGVSQAAWRNVLRYVDFMPAFFACGMLSVLISGKNQRVGDWLAGTVVIFRQEPQLPQQALAAGEATPPLWRLSRAEQRIIMDFAHYAQQHQLERAIELSEPFAALLPECSGEQRVARLIAYARYLQGAAKA